MAFCLCLGLGGAARAQTQTNSAALYLDCLTNFETYAESIWHDATGSSRPTNAGYWGDGGSSGNGGIRGSCGIAVAYAVLVKALPDDPRTSNRLARLTKALNYAANSHVSGTKTCVDGKQWGWSSSSSTDWQTPEWSASLGLACILVQSSLPAQTVADCRRVVASEATHRAGIAPASGYVGDTKAEENGWDSNILALSAAWLSGNTNAPAWLLAAKQYLANSYTVADTSGDPLASWVTTTTLYPSYALENHGFYHPTYEMVAGMSMGDSWLMALSANPTVANELRDFAAHNVLNVWSNNLQYMVLDSGEFAYPAGLDWELHDYEQNSYITMLAAQYNDPLARWADLQLAQLARYRQVVNGNGTFVGPSGGGFYREAVEAKRTAIAWLHWANAAFPDGPMAAPAPAVVHFPDVDVIVQRSAGGYVSLSYGSRIMAMIDAPSASVPTNVYVATPRLPGVIGLGALGTPTSAQLVGFTNHGDGFSARLLLQNGANGSTDVYFESTGESVAVVEVPRAAPGVVASAAGSFNVGIENDPLTGGSRLVEWTGGSATFTNRAGASRNISNNWVCVSGRYGLTAGPAGYFNYQTASSYNRLGAAEDTLQFMEASPLGARYAVWFPGKNAAQTAAGAALVNWNVSGTNATLTFPGPGGAPRQILAALAPPPPPYTPYLLSISNVTASSSQSGYSATNAVDQNLATFWVSSGSAQGEGPTTNHPEWLQVNFTRTGAVSGFQVAPRAVNGGYGPKDVQVFLDGMSVYQGTMSPTTTLAVALSPPVNATNALLWITSSYDPSFPADSRNVQVLEFSVFERAPPGTFNDWMLRRFTDAQLADLAIGGPQGDADGDGVANLAEFADGGDPWSPDASMAAIKGRLTATGMFALRFQETKALGDVQRSFEQSTNLLDWTNVVPVSVVLVGNQPQTYTYDALFPRTAEASFYRVKYTANGSH